MFLEIRLREKSTKSKIARCGSISVEKLRSKIKVKKLSTKRENFEKSLILTNLLVKIKIYGYKKSRKV